MSQPTQGQALDREPSPWTRPWFLASAAVVAVLIALAVLYVVLPSPGAAPAPTTSSSSTPSSNAPSAAESVCGLPAGDQRYPGLNTTSKWELLGKVAVPTDPKGFGPGSVKGDVRTCFAHNPTGALYAAANAVGLGALPGGSGQVVKHLMADSPERDRLLASPAPQAPSDPTVGAQIGGFTIDSYTDETAQVTLGIKLSPSGYMSVTYNLRWEAGDWKLENGDYETGLTDLKAFVPWEGVQ